MKDSTLRRIRSKPPLPAAAVFFVIAAAVWTAWLIYVGPSNAGSTILQHWQVALTMVFGSFVAGATSEGGGAVAFPVFTKVLSIEPNKAKLFSLAIQAVGMSSASLAIIAMRIRVDWRAIFWASVGGVFGIYVGLSFIAPLAPPAETKMLFTAMQGSFAVTLLVMLGRGQGRVQRARVVEPISYALLLAAGFAGGIASGMVGSGIDLIVFSMLVLLFKLSEKVATPTSVILMAINSISGILIHTLNTGPLPGDVISMWLSAVPIVVVGAPLGAAVCSRLSRHTIAYGLIGLITIEVTTSFILLPNTISVFAVAMIAGAGFSVLHWLMARCRFFEPWAVQNRASQIQCAA